MNIIEQINDKILDLKIQNIVPSKIILGKLDYKDFKDAIKSVTVVKTDNKDLVGTIASGINVYQHKDDRHVEVI